jgi:pyrroline-5-carboxylate reductase
MMDAATAISGSGPGYLCDFIEANGADHKKIEKFKVEFKAAAEELGFSRQAAIALVETTVSGTLKMLEGEFAPGQLKVQIASKGGTTEAGLKAWHTEGGTLKKAIVAAAMRARELSK